MTAYAKWCSKVVGINPIQEAKVQILLWVGSRFVLFRLMPQLSASLARRHLLRFQTRLSGFRSKGYFTRVANFGQARTEIPLIRGLLTASKSSRCQSFGSLTYMFSLKKKKEVTSAGKVIA